MTFHCSFKPWMGSCLTHFLHRPQGGKDCTMLRLHAVKWRAEAPGLGTQTGRGPHLLLRSQQCSLGWVGCARFLQEEWWVWKKTSVLMLQQKMGLQVESIQGHAFACAKPNMDWCPHRACWEFTLQINCEAAGAARSEPSGRLFSPKQSNLKGICAVLPKTQVVPRLFLDIQMSLGEEDTAVMPHVSQSYLLTPSWSYYIDFEMDTYPDQGLDFLLATRQVSLHY